MIKHEETKHMTPNINSQLKQFIINLNDKIKQFFPSEKLDNDSSPPAVLQDIDGALKVNLKSLVQKLEGKSVETLKDAIHS